MVNVRIAGVAIDSRGQHLILLKPLTDDAGTGRMLPIWIGPQEATSILIALEGIEPPRPLSHDLMTTLLAAVGATVERVDVTRIDEGTYYAEITLRTAHGTLVIDSRPSDAIALAARVDAPISVADEVLEEAGIADESEQPHDDEEQRLAEFRKFLDEVDPDDFQG
ncbi:MULTISPECIES: bifunctional nuclease family protein [unclassified Salinibacterium]|uniref:bifunctional nuclease family protein n=1 Tax=unclassified Salinibacterium TaxID=2632331 RepID=UPI001421CDF6|nr:MULTISPECIES: bifunctional nuclease family protein [unclassified Salinibacterium]